MVEHGRRVLAAKAARTKLNPYERVEFLDSARHGSARGHILTLRIVERLRRLVSLHFAAPLAQLHLVEHVQHLNSPEERENEHASVHCDESLFPAFHFSSVMWFSDYARDFTGGETLFYNGSASARTRETPANRNV